VVCGLGATMSSTAVTAIFIPVALRIAQSTGTPPARLMMPISVAAPISGMTTLIATAPNLVVNTELVHFLERKGQSGATGFQFFSFMPFGVPILALGIAYMLVMRRALGGTAGHSASSAGRPGFADWIAEYQLAEREHRVRVKPDPPMIGQSIQGIREKDTSGAAVIAIERNRKLMPPSDEIDIRDGDVLFVDLSAADANPDQVRQRYGVESLPLTGAYFTDLSQDVGMAEVIVPAMSDLVGKSVKDSSFRDRFGLTAVGLKRGPRALERGLRTEPLRVGDTLLVTGPWRSIRAVGASGKDLLVFNLPAELEEVLPVAGKAFHAVGCLALVVGMMIGGVVPNVQATLIGCLIMGLFGIVDLPSAYRAIDWKTIVLIVGMLPFSLALQRTGGVEMIADGLMHVIGGAGPCVVMASLFAITALLGMFISNTATAVLMAPIALAIAEDLNASPFPFAMIVALAASTAFMTPVSSPVNTLVVTPGNYTFGDFVKIGVPFSLIVMVVCVILVPWLMPL
jgi:di/tricarboxylate transporter